MQLHIFCFLHQQNSNLDSHNKKKYFIQDNIRELILIKLWPTSLYYIQVSYSNSHKSHKLLMLTSRYFIYVM